MRTNMHTIIEKGGNIDLVVIKRIDLMVFEHNCFATFRMGFAVGIRMAECK